MRIPDESLRRESERKIEDIAGYRYCPHCINCTLHSQMQIYSDGFFYCRYFKKWRKGDDLIEFKCKGYIGKSCSTCRDKKCKQRSKEKFVFCNKYINLKVQSNGYYYVGRRRKLRANSDRRIVELEERYIDVIRANYKRERIAEDREHQQVQTTDAGMGNL